jgi:hypothetical protein
MVEISFKGWLVETEYEVNRRFDRETVGFGAESCDCDYCRNFFVVEGEVYPAEVLELLEKLGVRRPLEAEVVHYGPENEGVLYHAEIPFFGAIKNKPESTSTVNLFEEFSLHVPEMAGRQVIQLAWPLVLPWVLEDCEYPG